MTSAMTGCGDWLNSTPDWDQSWAVWSQSLIWAKDYARQGSPVPRELLPPHIGRCQSSVTSIFLPPLSRHTTTSSLHTRPSGVLRHRCDVLECAAWWPPRPVAQCRQFQEDAKDASVSECTWTLSALEALRNALYKFKTYLLSLMGLARDQVIFQCSDTVGSFDQ